MVAKKTIFEKLGLVEPIENEHDEAVETTEEAAPNMESPSIEGDRMVQEEAPEPFGVDLLAAKNESVKEMLREASQEMAESSDVDSAQIEEKLDELIGSYEKNKMMSIDDIYRSSRMETDKKSTIFMVDVFQKTLPENLPLDVKRASVMNIMDVSSINLEYLLNDAYKRIDALNNVLEQTVQTTEEVLTKNEASIKELESRIKDLKKVNEVRVQFQEDQSSVIEYEIQKIIGIVDFIKPKK